MDHDHASAFIPEVVAAINAAYATACEIIEFQGGDQAVRLKAAEHMLQLARDGETDPDTLCSKSVIAALA